MCKTFRMGRYFMITVVPVLYSCWCSACLYSEKFLFNDCWQTLGKTEQSHISLSKRDLKRGYKRTHCGSLLHFCEKFYWCGQVRCQRGFESRALSQCSELYLNQFHFHTIIPLSVLRVQEAQRRCTGDKTRGDAVLWEQRKQKSIVCYTSNKDLLEQDPTSPAAQVWWGRTMNYHQSKHRYRPVALEKP